MKLLKSPIVLAVAGFVGGVILSDTVKPMLSKIPVIGGLIAGKSSANRENAE